MFDPSKFTTPTAKPLPVVLLLDVSGSMSGDKIDNLNKAVGKMLNTLAQEEKMETDILVSVITFGGQVDLHVPFTKASQVAWKDLQVNGNTPMGTAIKMAKEMIEDKETTPSRAYRPTIVLLSDGAPTDGMLWKEAMDDFISHGRSSKCDRMAMGIGNQGTDVLEYFVKDTPNPLFKTEDAEKIHEFFKRVTMSVTMRSQSTNPNVVPASIELDANISQKKSSVEDDDQGYW
jgi:uncharacterized protein YegL